MRKQKQAFFILNYEKQVLVIDSEWNTETLFKNILRAFNRSTNNWRKLSLELKKYPFSITKPKHIKEDDIIYVYPDEDDDHYYGMAPGLNPPLVDADVQTSVLQYKNASTNTSTKKINKSIQTGAIDSKYKNRMCENHYIKGKCINGDCTYAHNRIELLYFNWNNFPDKIRYCPYYVPKNPTSCLFGYNCKFIHCYEEYVKYQDMVNNN